MWEVFIFGKQPCELHDDCRKFLKDIDFTDHSRFQTSPTRSIYLSITPFNINKYKFLSSDFNGLKIPQNKRYLPSCTEILNSRHRGDLQFYRQLNLKYELVQHVMPVRVQVMSACLFPVGAGPALTGTSLQL
ncbi:hypothetical protein Nmel_002170 [Mimus melanotis]